MPCLFLWPHYFHTSCLVGPPGCGELTDFLAGLVPFSFSLCYTGFRQPPTAAAHFPTCRIARKAYPALLQNSLLHEPIFSFTPSKFVVSGGVASMKSPFCKNEMVVGSISQDRYALKWIPAEKDMGLLNFTPLVKGIKLTSLSDGTAVKAFYSALSRQFTPAPDDPPGSEKPLFNLPNPAAVSFFKAVPQPPEKPCGAALAFIGGTLLWNTEDLQTPS